VRDDQKALEEYDHRRFGPVLGVSDEGSAAGHIVEAAYKSAKAQALGRPGPMEVGVIIDGERMGSAGEVPIGPPEYEKVLAGATGNTFCTTNVGVRVNTRLHQPLPEFPVADAEADEQAWLDAVLAKFKPFIHTPDGVPRPLTVRLRPETAECREALRRLVPKLEAGRADGRLGSPELHRLSFLIVFTDLLTTPERIEKIRGLMALAAELGVPEVAIDGDLLEGARRRISVQGLLNVLEPRTARELLAYAGELGVQLVYHYEVDPETAARTVWTGLNSARRNGLSAAKYGLFPLDLEQQEYVVRHIQGWMADWTPIPAFYVDTALVTDTDIYESDRVVEAARKWIDMVTANGAKVALVDAPDRIDPHRLLKKGGPNDRGVISMDDLATLLEHAKERGLRVLWSGGISAEEAYRLGKLGVFGFFTTGSTARVVPVSRTLARDAMLASEKEPTELGVRRIHGLAGAGYLHTQLAERDAALGAEIETRAQALIAHGDDGAACASALAALDETLVRAWRLHWSD
jgi:hypothetical protein